MVTGYQTILAQVLLNLRRWGPAGLNFVLATIEFVWEFLEYEDAVGVLAVGIGSRCVWETSFESYHNFRGLSEECLAWPVRIGPLMLDWYFDLATVLQVPPRR